jgi:hypothetical protein
MLLGYLCCVVSALHVYHGVCCTACWAAAASQAQLESLSSNLVTHGIAMAITGTTAIHYITLRIMLYSSGSGNVYTLAQHQCGSLMRACVLG